MKIELGNEQIEELLALIDVHTPEHVPDHFWDEEKQQVFYYDQPSGKKVYVELSEVLFSWLTGNKLGI